MSDEKVNKKYQDTRIRDLIIIIMTFALFVFCTVMCIRLSVRYHIYTNADYVEEKATIVRYEAEERHNQYIHYNVYYEYIAPNGYKYTGVVVKNVSNFDYVESLIGSEFTIYVDHNLHIQKSDINTNLTTILIYGFGILPSFVAFLLFSLKLRAYYKHKK